MGDKRSAEQQVSIAIAHATGRYADDDPIQAATEAALEAIGYSDILQVLCQYESDLRYPPSHDSVVRRLERVRKVIAKATGDAPLSIGEGL